jgi:hypothetical protein
MTVKYFNVDDQSVSKQRPVNNLQLSEEKRREEKRREEKRREEKRREEKRREEKRNDRVLSTLWKRGRLHVCCSAVISVV